ncbi:sulfite exporter TauE/SafE family protein [bacterium]|nr:sulfite exporter TauE/SafE family protein [bacterium]
MYFPSAGIEISPIIPPLVAFIISFFTSMGGVSGAFLLLPFQISMLGFTSPAVSSTNQLYNIVAIPSGVWRYIKEGRMVWQLTWIVVIATTPGIIVGAIIRIKYLPNPTNFKLFAGLVLVYIGSRLVKDLMRKSTNDGSKSSEARFQELVKSFHQKKKTTGKELPRVKVDVFNISRLVYEFYGESYSVSVPAIFSISAIVGVVGGIYGIGGGAIIAPIYVAIFNLPVYTIAGAALMGTFLSSIVGVLSYQGLAPLYPTMQVSPDWLLGILFGVGGFAGMYCGARLQKYFPAKFIKWMLAGSIFFLSFKYIIEFFFK